MRHHRLRTLGPVLLVGPDGPVALDEPRLVALLAMLAVAGNRGVAEDELMLRIVPSEEPAHGRTELARLIAVARLRLGGERAILRTSVGYTLAPGVLVLDVRVLEVPMANECADFLAGFDLHGSPEFREWLTEMRRRVAPLASSTAVPISPMQRRRLLATVATAAALLIAAFWFALPRG